MNSFKIKLDIKNFTYGWFIFSILFIILLASLLVLIKNETKELAFSVSINQYDIDTMIVNFTDISETFNQKMIF